MEPRQPVLLGPIDGTWVSWIGGPVRYLARGSDTADTYALAIGRVPSGQGAKSHRHAFEEVFIVVKGELTFTAGTQSVIIPKNGSIAIGGGTVHSFTNAGTEEAEIVVLVAPTGFDRFQIEVGRLTEATGPYQPEHFQSRLEEAAPRHGIDLHPPASAFLETPRITVTRPGEGRTVAVTGDVYRYLATGADTSGKCAIWEAIVPPGGGPPPHVHSREEEGFYILEGSITFNLDQETIVATAGMFANMPVGVPHSFKNESDQPARMLILIAPAGLEQMFIEVGTELSPGTITAHPPSPDEISRLLQIAPRYGVDILVR